jgi:inosine-uridine nucleoside N-ribohydrolase
MHDVCALVPFVAPDLLSYAPSNVQVELAGIHTRGATVCDLRGVRPGSVESIKVPERTNARVALAVQGRGLIDLVVDTLLEYP